MTWRTLLCFHPARWLVFTCFAAQLVGGGAALAAQVDCPPEFKAPSSAQLAQARDHARDRGFLWRLTKSGHVSYLYGTLHVGKLAWAFPGPTVLRALEDSQVVALELDLQDPEVMAGLKEGLVAPADGAQARALPEDLSRRLRAQVEAACLPSEARQALEAYSPEMVLVTLALLSGRRDGLEAAYGTDLLVSGLAHQAHKEVVSLETPESQVALLRSESPEAFREGLALNLAKLEDHSARRELRHVADLWADSRFDELMRYPAWCACLDTEAQREALKKVLDDRNLPMAERIDALHDEGRTVFAAVGSLHMVGPLGLPELMARRGYRVERLDFSAPARHAVAAQERVHSFATPGRRFDKVMPAVAPECH